MNTQNVNVKTATKESSERWVKTPAFCGPVRGLSVRIAWGKARVMAVIDAERAAEEMSDAAFEAQVGGDNDYRSGRLLPHMFADVPELAAAWELGRSFAAVSDEMDSCTGCRNDRGEPCPLHG